MRMRGVAAQGTGMSPRPKSKARAIRGFDGISMRNVPARDVKFVAAVRFRTPASRKRSTAGRFRRKHTGIAGFLSHPRGVAFAIGRRTMTESLFEDCRFA